MTRLILENLAGIEFVPKRWQLLIAVNYMQGNMELIVLLWCVESNDTQFLVSMQNYRKRSQSWSHQLSSIFHNTGREDSTHDWPHFS